MPKSKHNRKRHNGNKRGRRLMDRTTLFTWEALRDVNGKQIRTRGFVPGRPEMTPTDVERMMIEPANQWFLMVRAICMAADGKAWISYEFPREDIQGRLHGTGEVYWALRDQVLAKQRTDHVYDIGWIAQHYVKDSPRFDEERLDAMARFETGAITDYRRYMWRQVNRDVMEDREAA